MQNMFRMIGYGENLGSGFPLILNAWNEKHWIKPELLEQPELMQVKLTLHIQNKVASGSLNDPINAPINLTERQKLILQMFSEEKNLSRERLCEETGLSDATAKRVSKREKKCFSPSFLMVWGLTVSPGCCASAGRQKRPARSRHIINNFFAVITFLLILLREYNANP